MIATESFLPHVNGVTNSVLRVLEHLQLRGVEAMVVATGREGPAEYAGAPVVRLRSLPLPGYADVRISVAATSRIEDLINDWQPDVVHLASPFTLGHFAAKAAARANVPAVAVFQTDVAGYARHYRVGAAENLAWQQIRRVHSSAAVTLAPSRATAAELTSHEIPRVAIWPRGVDAERFNPSWRSAAVRERLAPNGERLVGYVGRLAYEKQVEDLAALHDLPGTRLVIGGDGPLKDRLRKLLPNAAFVGFLAGTLLSTLLASLDVFVHPGANETFCQGAQEALASGVPVVAVGAVGLLDLVDPSRTGWLYQPGELTSMRSAVADLVGDEFKRSAMGTAARTSVMGRTWASIGDRLLDHYLAVQLVRSA